MTIPPEENSLLLEALSRLKDIGLRINQLNLGDPAALDAILHLIVESAITIVPDAAAIIYTYDVSRQAIDPVSRVAAGAEVSRLQEDQPRPAGLGARAIAQQRAVLSYDESDLEIHPAKQAAGARVVVCLPLIVAEQPLGVLYVYLLEERRLSELELLLLANFVNQAATAIHHAGQSIDVRRDLARKEDELTLLRRAGLLISSRSRLEDTLEAILQMALEVTGARYGIFRLVDSPGRNLVMRAIAGDQLGRPAVEALPINTTSIMGWVAVTRRPLNIADVCQPPWSRIYYPLDHALQMHSDMAVPLIGAGGRLEGVLNLESPQVAAFSEADSHLLQALATQAVTAIQEVRLLDALQEMAEHLLTHPAQQVLNHLAELACDLMGGVASAVWLLNGQELVLHAASAGHVRGDKLSLQGSLTGQAILTRDAVICEDVRADPRFGWPELARAQGWTRALIVPLIAAEDSEPVGAFSVYGSAGDQGRFSASDWDKKVLTILAHYAALGVRNEANQAALRAVEEQRATAEAFAAIGDIAANLLHHLNNKVGTIPVRIEGIQDKCAPALAASPYLATNLAEIERAALDAMAAVRERLSLLHPIERAPVSVADCVADALAAARLPAELTVVTTGLDQLPPVMAGREELALVIVNLLDNAAEALDGQGHISISGLAHTQSVELAVSDDGPGIAPELQGRIFEFNFSSRRRAGPNREGAVRAKLGFGLWWVKTLMTRVGGAIAVESDGQRGATFRLLLPRAEVDVTLDATEAQA